MPVFGITVEIIHGETNLEEADENKAWSKASLDEQDPEIAMNLRIYVV